MREFKERCNLLIIRYNKRLKEMESASGVSPPKKPLQEALDKILNKIKVYK